MSASIFISHSSKDQAVAETLCAYLEGPERGFGCWYAARDVPGGDNYAAAIPAAIRGARVMLFIYSENSNNSSDEVLRELTLASQYKLTVIPLRLTEVEPVDALRFHLATRQWIDYFPGKEDEALARLTRRIGAVLAPPTPPPPPAPPFVGEMLVEPEPVEAPVAEVAAKPAKNRAAKPKAETKPEANAETNSGAGSATETPPSPPAPPAANAEVEALLSRGDAYYNIGKYDLALAEYGRAVQLMPALARANNARGLAYQGLAIYDLAVIDFDEAIRLQPDYAQAYCNRGNVFLRTSQEGRAQADYDAAIRFKPDLAAAYNNRGFIYSTQSMFDRAIVEFDAALNLKSDFVLALQNRAHAYARIGRSDLARRDRLAAAGLLAATRKEAGGLRSWQLAAGLAAAFIVVLLLIAGATNPSPTPDTSSAQAPDPASDAASAGPVVSTAEDVTNCGATPISITACDNIINDSNQSVDNQALAQNNLGVYYYNTHQYADAVTHYAAAVALSKTADHYTGLADSYYSLGGTANDTLAMDNYNAALTRNAQDDIALNGIANINDVNGNYDTAIDGYTQAINASPKALYYDNRARTYNRRNGEGDYGRAIQDLDTAINIDPQDSWAYHMRGIINNAQSAGTGDADIATATRLGYTPS